MENKKIDLYTAFIENSDVGYFIFDSIDRTLMNDENAMKDYLNVDGLVDLWQIILENNGYNSVYQSIVEQQINNNYNSLGCRSYDAEELEGLIDVELFRTLSLEQNDGILIEIDEESLLFVEYISENIEEAAQIALELLTEYLEDREENND